MSKYLPERILPLRMVEAGQRLAGRISTQSMPRLKQELAGPDVDIDVDLKFSRDEAGKAVLTGGVQGALRFICQRCLDPVDKTIVAPVALRIVERGDSRAFRETENDYLEVGEDPISLYELIEDELLLAIPYVPMHDHECGTDVSQRYTRSPQEERDSRESPFAVLAEWKKRNEESEN